MVAIGTNEEAVRLSGIDPRPIKGVVFAASGLLAGLAAVVHTARLASADPNAGSGLELQAIAAVVIGGTSLMGGRGSVVRSLFGVVIIAVLGTRARPDGRGGADQAAHHRLRHRGRGRRRPLSEPRGGATGPMRSEIVVVGSLNADLVARLDRFPAPGETVTARDFAVHPGGKGANQAYAAARLGGDAWRCWAASVATPTANCSRESLQGAGVDVSLVGRDAEAPTGMALITLDASGENQIVVVPGANARLTPGARAGARGQDRGRGRRPAPARGAAVRGRGGGPHRARAAAPP